jgi:rhodanese-related sulfurtransferase
MNPLVSDISTSLFLTSRQFAARLGHADAPLVLDVRRLPRFTASQRLLPTAQHCAAEDVLAFVAPLPPREVLVYCVYGHEVSQGAAAALRSAGWEARYLLGGIEGGEPSVDAAALLAELQAQHLPTVAKCPDFGVDGTAPSRWITRERPKIDRIACPWLVRRFMDPRASFFYVPTAQVLVQAAERNAVAYDIPGAPLEHDGALCSFDSFLRAFDLHLPALNLLATIVRGADTDQLDLAAQSAGLLAVSLGFSKLHATNDHAMLDAMMPVYDALYAWCCDRVAATDERHSWKP